MGLCYFNGRGNLVWGARTLSADPGWKYINVRRLSLMVKEAITKGTEWSVFEPNNERLWAKVKTAVTGFLSRLWYEDGALQGSKPEEAFLVKVDRTTMTQQDINNGRLIILVGIAPVKPGEFFTLRIFQKTLPGN